MVDIVIATLNAKYPHAAFGLRYLMANLEAVGLGGRAEMLEFEVSQRSVDVVEAILGRGPRVVGLGVYIWNAEQSLRVVAELRRVRPEVIVVLGGPEVSYETEGQEIVRYADYVITGEGDVAFAELCEKLLEGRRPLQKVIAAGVPEFGGKRRSDGATKRRRVGITVTQIPSSLRAFVASSLFLITCTPITTWRIASFMWRRRGGVRLSVSFVCRRWTCRFGMCRLEEFSGGDARVAGSGVAAV